MEGGFAAIGVGLAAPAPGAPAFSRSSACTSIPTVGQYLKYGTRIAPRALIRKGACRLAVGYANGGRPTFFEQDTFEQGVLVAQHQAFISGATMILLEGLQGVFIALNGGLELADVLCATLTEGSLGLAVALLPLLRGSIDLTAAVSFMSGKGWDQGSR